MQQSTFTQRIALKQTKTDTQKVNLFIEYGFTKEEAEAMVKGSTEAQAIERLGGVWRVGNVHWAQAISKEHAQKLHFWNFGVIEQTNLVNGIYVVE